MEIEVGADRSRLRGHRAASDEEHEHLKDLLKRTWLFRVTLVIFIWIL